MALQYSHFHETGGRHNSALILVADAVPQQLDRRSGNIRMT
jgi:hypothetical protein